MASFWLGDVLRTRGQPEGKWGGPQSCSHKDLTSVNNLDELASGFFLRPYKEKPSLGDTLTLAF